jgi:hypothetical protein
MDYRALTKKYPLGLSLTAAQARTSAPYEIIESYFATNVVDEKFKRSESFRLLIVKDGGPILEFNYYNQLIRVRWNGPPPLRVLERGWKHLNK